MSGTFFIHFTMSTFASSVAILFILMVKKGIKKHISTRWQYNMDLLILILLAIPLIPSGFLNAISMGNWANVLSFGGRAAANVNVPTGEGTRAMYGTGLLQDFSVSVDRAMPEYLPSVFLGVWIVGIVVFVVITLLCNRNLRLVRESMKPVENAEILSLFMRCKMELGIKKDIRLGMSVLVKTPITVGIFKTHIILPAGKMPANAMCYALLHELAHCKNRDIQLNSIICLFQILYWFNPLVYLVFKEMRLDREMACDTSVLNMLPEESRLDYGKTLLNFVATMSRMTTFSFTTDMGGSKPQITKRVKHIASFTTETRLLRAKSVCIFTITSFFVFSQILAISALASYDSGNYNFKADNIIYEDLSSFFTGYEGSIVLYDLDTDMYTIHNKAGSLTRVSPDSTYKIYSALIALETGVIDAKRSVREWDGTAYAFEAWNQDQDLMSAMQNSVNWYFQELDAQVGIKELDAYFTRLAYGNHDLSGGITNYWMESTLRISPVEQVELLRSFYQNAILFKTEHVDTMKDILRLSEKNGAELSGKTGTGSVNGKVTNGWFIGYVENKGHTCIFATNIQGKDNAGGSTAVQITLSILKDKGIY